MDQSKRAISGHHKLPGIIYNILDLSYKCSQFNVQHDGGPENGSKNFMALCHLMVYYGICRVMQVKYPTFPPYLTRINYPLMLQSSRLPVGHTHNDPDGIFGAIHVSGREKVIVNPQQHEELLNAVLGKSNQGHEVIVSVVALISSPFIVLI
jgi:hypothetical protein